jgi:hypothetical protein
MKNTVKVSDFTIVSPIGAPELAEATFAQKRRVILSDDSDSD